MNTATLAQTGYAAARAVIPSSRETEYRAFAEVTRRLSENTPVTATNFPRIAAAVHLNQRLWSVLASDVADERNRLPAELRAQILSLADFTRNHARQVLQGKASADVLVEINTTIMRGLRQDIGGSQ